jgi:hypothetical protein
MSIKVRDVGAAVLQPKYLFEIKHPISIELPTLRLHPALPALQGGAATVRPAVNNR